MAAKFLCAAVERLGAEERLVAAAEQGGAGYRVLIDIGGTPFMVLPETEAFLMANPQAAADLVRGRWFAGLLEKTKRLRRKEEGWELTE